MSYLNKMYGRNSNNLQPQHSKNPNRVLGGLKGAGVDTFSMLGEDGLEKRIPTEAYVKGLEEKVRLQDERITVLEKKIRRLANEKPVGFTNTQSVVR
jgi:hypothetical protein